jgi:murein DD-endopeptidase MepM/ murein hydrolase activator NlpD
VRPGDAGGAQPVSPSDASGGDPVPPGDAADSVPVVPVGATLVSDGDTGSFTFQRHRFPIVGAHTFGTGAAAFGGGRGHQGQDVFAECGTPIVAARGGRVKVKQYEGRAGNYVVIDGAATSVDFAYMHLRDEALADEGDRVHTGQLIGFVGDTGRADGCHLHFEMWTEPGWYAGGTPFDPLPELRAWDALS